MRIFSCKFVDFSQLFFYESRSRYLMKKDPNILSKYFIF